MRLLKELYKYRHMVGGLVQRELRGRYKRSVLGFLWTFLNPLFMFLVYLFIFSTIRERAIPQFYLFLFVAIIPWHFFSSALTGGCVAVLHKAGMVKKIYFPREVLPIAFVTSGFINMLYSFVIVLIVVFFSGVHVNPVGLLCLPLVMIIEYILALGITFILSSITVYFQDMQHIMHPISMMVHMLSGIFYQIENMPEKYQKILEINPMVPILRAYRAILYSGKIPDLSTLLLAFAESVVFLLIGIVIFENLKKHFAEEM